MEPIVLTSQLYQQIKDRTLKLPNQAQCLTGWVLVSLISYICDKLESIFWINYFTKKVLINIVLKIQQNIRPNLSTEYQISRIPRFVFKKNPGFEKFRCGQFPGFSRESEFYPDLVWFSFFMSDDRLTHKWLLSTIDSVMCLVTFVGLSSTKSCNQFYHICS